jgi:predicted nuclease with TOPRIM domain
MAVMAREKWTDERLDDLKEHMDEGFGEVKAELRSTRAELKGEIGSLRKELKGEIAATRLELKAENGELRGAFEKLNERFDRLNLTLIAALIGLLATHYLG